MKALELKHIYHSQLDAYYGKTETESFFYICLDFYLNIPRYQLTLQPNFTLSKCDVERFLSVLSGLKQHQPIQYLLGETEFYDLKLYVNPSVLIPRQETEELVHFIIKNHEAQNRIANKTRKLKVLDIGTGSGCIAISLAKNLVHTEVFALDVSENALEVSKSNAKRNAVNIHFIHADILNKSTWNLGFEKLQFDIIVSNPPYVRQLEKSEIQPNVLNYEPHLALFVNDDHPLKFYEAITAFSKNNLKSGGALYFEINQYLGEETKQLLVDANFKDIELLKDLNGNYRILKGIK